MSSDGAQRNGRCVVIEGHNLLLKRGTGIATYSRGLASVLREAGFDTDLLVGTNRSIPRRDRQLAEVVLFDAPRNYNLFHKAYIEYRRAFGAPLGLRAGSVDGPFGTVVDKRNMLDGYGRVHAVSDLIDVEYLHFMRYKKRLNVQLDGPCDLFHSPRPAPIRVARVPNIYTVHDIVPLRLPYTTADDKNYFAAMVRDLARTADHIVTVSEFSKRDIIAFTGMSEDRISNTYQTVSFPSDLVTRPISTVADNLHQRFGLEHKEYYLFVGAIEPKKNISRLIDAYAHSGTKRPLVIVGGLGWMYEADQERMNSERFLSYIIKGGRAVPQRQVRHLSYLPIQDIVDLIRGARALVYPSVYEGFGLPVAEAMLLGTPVLTSNVASLPEIAGGAALLVEPYDTDSIKKGIRALDSDTDLLNSLTERGHIVALNYTAEKHKDRIVDIYRKFIAGI